MKIWTLDQAYNGWLFNRLTHRVGDRVNFGMYCDFIKEYGIIIY